MFLRPARRSHTVPRPTRRSPIIKRNATKRTNEYAKRNWQTRRCRNATIHSAPFSIRARTGQPLTGFQYEFDCEKATIIGDRRIRNTPVETPDANSPITPYGTKDVLPLKDAGASVSYVISRAMTVVRPSSGRNADHVSSVAIRGTKGRQRRAGNSNEIIRRNRV